MDRNSERLLRTLIARLAFDHLHTFKVIVEARSFRKAAERLAISQAAVSQRVKHLEEVLGSPVFDRQRGSPVSLTQAGERLLLFTEAMLDAVDRFRQDLSAVSGPRSGDRLVVAAGPSFIKYELLPMMEPFRARYPNVHVRLRHSATPDDVLALVLNGEADLGVYVGHLPKRPVRRFPLINDRLMLVAPPGHPVIRLHRGGRLKVVSQSPFAISSAAAHSRQLIQRWASHYGVELQIQIEADNLDTLKEAVLQGVALAVLPDFAVVHELRDGKLVSVDAPGLEIERRVFAIADMRTPPSAAARAFLESLAEHMRNRRQEVRAIR